MQQSNFVRALQLRKLWASRGEQLCEEVAEKCCARSAALQLESCGKPLSCIWLRRPPPPSIPHIDFKFAWICVILQPLCKCTCGIRKLQRVCAVVTWPQDAFLVGTSAFDVKVCCCWKFNSWDSHTCLCANSSMCIKKFVAVTWKLEMHSWFTPLQLTSRQPEYMIVWSILDTNTPK